MKGYGVYYDNKMVAWFASAEQADDFRCGHKYNSCSYTVKPTEIGILMEPCGTYAPYPDEVRRGAELKIDEQGMPHKRHYREVKKQELKIGQCGKEVDTATMLGDGLCSECYTSEVNSVEHKKTIADVGLKTVAEDGSCNLCNSDGDCLLDITPCTQELPSMCESRKQYKRDYMDKMKNITSEVEATGTPRPYNREEWLAENPLTKYMDKKGIGLIVLHERIGNAISIMRLQKMTLGFEEPKASEYVILAQAMYVRTSYLREEWEHWLMRAPSQL